MTASVLEQQMRKWVEAFENLTRAILDSKSPKNYKELFAFFDQNTESDQIFFWRKSLSKQKNSRLRGVSIHPKQKFLSLNKTSLEEFDILYSKFESLQFNNNGYYLAEGYLYIKINTNEHEYFGFIFKEFAKNVLENETLMLFFLNRLSGILYLVDKYEQTQSLSFVDDVTGLHNQRYLHILLDQEIERFKRHSQPFCVLFIDVDHFKNVNDKNGHIVGSQVLKEIGAILRKNVRSVDFCFRYGGDEFIIILTATDTAQAMVVADRVCKSVHDTTFLVNGVNVQVTLSIGVAGFPEHAQTKEKIIQVADEAMYHGKNLSRNIVYVAS